MYSFPIEKDRVAVKVQRIGQSKSYCIVPDSLSVIKQGTLVLNLPDGYKIIDESGEEIKAIGEFMISAETIDPYHLVVDLF